MSSHAAGGAMPSLVEFLKPIAREWRDFDESSDDHWDHSIWDLLRLIEEHTGISRTVLEETARRLNSGLGLAPLRRVRLPKHKPATNDPNLDDFPDFGSIESSDRPDLRWVCEKFAACDADGRTVTILRRFSAAHPESAFVRELPFQSGGRAMRRSGPKKLEESDAPQKKYRSNLYEYVQKAIRDFGSTAAAREKLLNDRNFADLAASAEVKIKTKADWKRLFDAVRGWRRRRGATQ